MDFRSSNILLVLLALVISITLHEAMHAYTAHWLGDDTAEGAGRISFNPLRHIDPFLTIVLPAITLLVFGVPLLAAKPVPFNPYRVRYHEYGAALVGVAGPLTNLFLAIVAGAGLRVFGGSISFGLGNFLYIFTELNVALFVFNMVPIPPLDGSRLLYAFAPEGVQKIMAQMEQFGIFLVFAIILMVPGFSTLLGNIDSAVLRLILPL